MYHLQLKLYFLMNMTRHFQNNLYFEIHYHRYPNPGELSELKFCDNLVDNFNNEDSSYEINYTESMYNSGNGYPK